MARTTDPWKRYFDAGVELTQLTRQRAEKVVRDLMKAGEVQREEAQDRVEELLERSRRSTEAVIELVRVEVSRQLSARGITARRGARSASKPTGTPTAAKKATAPAKKTAKKATAPAKNTPKRATAPAKKTAKKATAPAKKSTKKAAATVKKATKKAPGAS